MTLTGQDTFVGVLEAASKLQPEVVWLHPDGSSFARQESPSIACPEFLVAHTEFARLACGGERSIRKRQRCN
jgi:hypothetical protein